ncbi:uncharacterized protein LOC143678302 [Tamandua tetradactyla]|uniref:uncharacterized protein LOC143678302 n=1 Tax=Tamandua tetradactyla TaxID=48850 RepID=UPI0040548090
MPVTVGSCSGYGGEKQWPRQQRQVSAAPLSRARFVPRWRAAGAFVSARHPRSPPAGRPSAALPAVGDAGGGGQRGRRRTGSALGSPVPSPRVGCYPPLTGKPLGSSLLTVQVSASLPAAGQGKIKKIDGETHRRVQVDFTKAHHSCT